MAIAKLAMENGMVFTGVSFGAQGESDGEVVFNTSMTGYQEILTDPSYHGQIVTMTYPLIGNYGINPEDKESAGSRLRGFVIRELAKRPSNYRHTCALEDYLAEQNILGIQGIDTRTLVLTIRDQGALKGILSTTDLDDESLVAKAKASMGLVGRDLAREVMPPKAIEWTERNWESWRFLGGPKTETPLSPDAPHVIAMDFGMKWNIARCLVESGCKVTVVPGTMSAKEILDRKPDGVFLSNGPGDPEPLTYATETLQKLFGEVPIFGICLGHQLLGQALGGKTFKLKFGHRGANQPVLNQRTNRVEITSQNHGFAVDAKSLPSEVESTHINLNDQTNEGLRHKTLPIFSVQYHPEASAGPHDSAYLFKEFVELMAEQKISIGSRVKGPAKMGATVVVGLQWGDEAKGKVVDLLSEQHDVVVRFNGGANAGHTIVLAGETYKLSLVPSGIVNPKLKCVIGNGTVIHASTLLEEISRLETRGVKIQGRLFLSDRAHVILPYHLEEEKLAEEAAGDRAIGTTRRGVGPCYSDKAGRAFSVRVHDFVNPEQFRSRLHEIVPHKNQILAALSPAAKRFQVEEIADEYGGYAKRLQPYVADTFWLLQNDIAAGKRILLETAQGSLLDVDHGSYPYVTSSNSSVCGVSSGCGIPPKHIEKCIGIVKAYTSRVGAGPFPTELDNDLGEHIRKRGREYGTVTGRPRRCGWLDTVAARYSAKLNGVDSVAIMLLDVLDQLDEIKVCGAYEIDGQRTNEFPVHIDLLERCKPVWQTFAGWKKDISGCRKAAELPKEARTYLDGISELLSAPIGLCSVGPDREQTVIF